MAKSKTIIIEVFITNIPDKIQSKQIRNKLLLKYPDLKIDFDLEDVDKVLRVEGKNFNSQQIINILVSEKIKCQIMN